MERTNLQKRRQRRRQIALVRRRNKAMRVLSIFMAFCMVMTYSGVMTFADTASYPSQIVSGGAGDAKTLYWNAGGDQVAASGLGNNGAVVSTKKFIEDSVNGVRLPENKFKITLEVKTTEEVTEALVPTDALVVLVIDVSGSMGRNELYSGGRDRMKVAEDAAKTFIDSYANVDGYPGVTRGLAVVKFGSNVEKILDWTNVAGNAALGKNAVNNLNNASVDPGTNIAGGLRYANNLFGIVPEEWGDITNAHVILLSDGGPTCATILDPTTITTGNLYLQEARDDNLKHTDGKMLYNFGTTNVRGEGTWNAARTAIVTPSVNVIDQSIVASGSDPWNNSATNRNNHYYNNARYAIIEANSLKANSYEPVVHTIGFTTQNYKTSEREYWAYYRNASSADNYYTTDPDNMGANMSVTNCLRSLSSDGTVYDAANENLLINAFKKIYGSIAAEPWVVTDKMGDNMIFSEDPDNLDDFVIWDPDENEFKWDLTKDYDYDTYKIEGSNTTIYTYTYSYMVTLDNLNGYEALKSNDTNALTELTYVITINGVQGDQRTAGFESPVVKGFADGLDFKKVDQNGGALDGAKFELYCNGSLFAEATSSDGGKVSFGDVPSGHEYTLLEVSAPTVNGVKYVADNTQYNLNVSYGTLAGGWTGSFSGSGGNLTFRNSPESFKVTVQYWVKGAGGDTYRQVRHMTAVQDGYLNGETYEWTIGGADVYESINAYGRNYYFAEGENEFTEDGFITGAPDKAALEGTINNSDVVINLYYTRIAMPDVPVTKSINISSDSTGPDDYSFTFALYAGDDKVKITKDLIIGKADVGETQYFKWDLPRGMKPADLRGADLFIKEEPNDGWNSDVTGKYVLYGTLNSLVGFQPDEAFANGNITNDYTQKQYDADIKLYKSFTGNGAELLPEFDGAILYPYHEETEAQDAVFNYQEISPAVISHDGEGHNDTCYDDSGELICGEEDMDAVFGYAEISPAAIAHKHDNSCYAYEFTFDLTAMIGDTVKYTDQDTIMIPYDDMLDLLNGVKQNEIVSFTIPKGSLPAPGSGEVLSVSITESDNNYGWAANADVSGIAVDAYGNVTYPNQLGYAEMTNTFNGIKVPGFGFAKTVVDARSLFGGIASYYTGDFTFELSGGDGYSDTITLKAVKGIGSASIELPRYIGAEYAELTLKEVPPANRVAGMTYDGREFKIVIEDGQVTQVNPTGRLDKTPIVFVNTLLEPVDPVVTVNKWVNTETEKAGFTFSWSYEGFENANLLSPRPVSASGTDSITVNDGGDPFFDIELPRNFTGKLTITEGAGKFIENWIYDTNNTRTINYILGKPVGRNATSEATFYNNYNVPEIELAKTVSSNNVARNEAIAYTITVVNTGAEDLANVVITDAMFNDTVKVLKPAAGPNALGSALSEGDGYILDLDEGTITLLADLKQGEKVFVRYTVLPNGAGEIYNIATVEAERTVTVGDNVTAWDDETVVVDKNVSQLLVKKYVAQYKDGLDFEDESIAWNANGINFTSTGNKAVFKVVIKNTGNGALYVNDVTDTFGKTDLKDATFYYGGESYSGLEALIEELKTVPLYSGDGELVFYFITDALNTRGTFTNQVTVKAVDNDQAPHEGSDEASVTTERDRGNPPNNPPHGNGGNPPRGDGDNPPTTIGDPDVPQAILPKDEDKFIPEEDVPLADIPRTGSGSLAASAAMLGMSMMAMMTMIFKGRKKEK